MVNSVSDIKKDFPIFSDPTQIYLDSASTSQKPRTVLDALGSVYREANANVHRAIYSLGSEATERFETARTKVAHFINATSEKEIVFTGGATGSINLLAFSLGTQLNVGDEILVSEMEHHSNLVPWQLAAQRNGASLRYIPITESGDLDLKDYEKYFTPKTKIVSITHMSNVLGTINPATEIGQMAHDVGAIFILDGAQ